MSQGRFRRRSAGAPRAGAGRGPAWDGDRALRREVALGCRVLALEGLAEGMLGIVGGRRPGAETFWIKSSDLRLEEVTPESLLCFDLEGKLLAGDRPPHSEIPSGWVGPSPSGWAGPRPCSSSTTAW